MNGRVYLIGAGPGDPELLTLRGAKLLAQSDVVLYDGLSNRALLSHCADAEHICVGKHGQTRIWQQSEIIDEMLRHARAGKRVARLKGGDPAVFARTAEEVEALQQAGIPFEIVPGITAALAAGSFAGIPITHRRLASAVALVTGHEEPNKPESALDWDALARFPGTLVIYMGVTTAESWTQALLQAGKSPETPAALIRRCSLPDQQTLRCTLGEVAEQLTPASKFRPPVIVIIGEVARLTALPDSVLLPLAGQTILVTRPLDQAEALAEPLREGGAQVLIQPAIEIAPPADWSQVDAALDMLDDQDFLVFCSHNGVHYFLRRLLERGGDLRQLAGIEIAVVGSKTAQSLRAFHLKADVVPADFRAESLAETLGNRVQGKRVLIVRASRGRDVLAPALKSLGAEVTQIATYEHRDIAAADPAIVQAAQNNKIDWVTLTSSATAESVANMLGEAMHRMKIATLSPVTSEKVRQLGFHVDVEADPYTIENLVNALKENCRDSKTV